MFRERIIDYSKGDNLSWFWRFFRLRERVRRKLSEDVLTFLCNRMAHRHGGYIGNGAKIASALCLPHGLHGIYISRYASIGNNCRIYQNVTIGEVNRIAPSIGDNCLIGAGAVIIGNIRIGDNVKIGAGAVVSKDVPDNCTVIPRPSRIIDKEKENVR
jgi:Serine acetyltransferase